MKKSHFFVLPVLCLVLTSCGGNNAFEFDGNKTTKIEINDVDVTDEELIKEIALMFKGLDGNKDTSIHNGRDYDYFLITSGDEENQYFSIGDSGELYKPMVSNDPDIFGLNYCYIGYMDNEDFIRFKEIYDSLYY